MLGDIALHAVEVDDDVDYPYTAYLMWRLPQPWVDADLDALEATLPGRPCVLQPPTEHPETAEITVRVAEASDEAAAAQGAHAQVAQALQRRGLLGRAVSVSVWSEDGYTWDATSELIEAWASA